MPHPKRAKRGTRPAQLEALLYEGHTNKEMAARMGLTEGTVKVYVCQLMAARGFNTRNELMASRIARLAIELAAKADKIAELSDKVARLEGHLS